MQTVMQPRIFFEKLLARTGGWYIVIAVAISQITAATTIVLSFISEQLNAEYTPEILTQLRKLDILVLPIVFLLQFGIGIFLAKSIRAGLNQRKRNPDAFTKQDYPDMWKLSNTLIWKFALSTGLTTFFLIILPRTLLLYSTKVVTNDQVIYALMAGLISLFTYVPLSTIILDRLLVPVRQVFLPSDFSTQLSGLSRLRILNKTLALVFFFLIVTALLIAPIGYHQTTRALSSDIDPGEVLYSLQIQSIVVSFLAILYAFGLTYLFAKSISDPLALLMESFVKVENGDLFTRAPVTSSDEISKLSIYFNRMVARLQALQSDLEKKVEERTSQLRAINEVGRVATSILDPEELLASVVDLITKEFGYYYSAIYLVDNTGHSCNLMAATGEAGRVLKESNHQVEISDKNTIGKSIRKRQAQVALDNGDNLVRFDNPLLPYTRSALSLPLIVGEQVLGALDVHSTQPVAFTEQDIETLQNMANQVAISLDNARLFQETRQRLNELRNLQKQYLREAWVDSSLPTGVMSMKSGDSTEVNADKLTAFPISLRDQIIGELTLGTDEPLSAEDRNWIQSVATQTALALENARLLEESQSAALREKYVTEITNKIWASTSVDGVLQTTVKELGQILDVTEATIEINIDENRGIA